MTAQKDSLRERIIKAIKGQKRPTVTILSSLLAVQDEIGFIPQQAIEEVAVKMNTSNNEVFGIASFYPNFRFTPPPDHTVEVCWGPTCHLEGGAGIVTAMMSKLGLIQEGDSNDGKISFRLNTCLGACSQAPVASLDHELFGRLDQESATRLIDKIN